MHMLEFICYFMPSFISLSIHNYLFNEKDTRRMIINYGIFCVVNNLITIFIIMIRHINEIYTFDRINMNFCFKYLAVSTIFSIITPYIVNIKNIKYIEKIKSFINVIKKNKNKIISFLKKVGSVVGSIFVRIATFIIIFVNFYLIDLFVRTKCFELTNYYGMTNMTTLVFTISFCLLLTITICFLPKKVSKIVYYVSFILFLLLYLTHYFLIAIKENAFSIFDIVNASEGSKYLNFLIEEINTKLVFSVILLIALFIVGVILLSKTKKEKFRYTNLIFITIGIGLFFGGRYYAVNSLGEYDPLDWQCYVKPSYYYYNLTNVNRSLNVLGLYEYSIKDFFNFFKSTKPSKEDLNKIDNIVENRGLKLEDNEYTDVFKNKNLIMIMMESIDYLMVNDDALPTLSSLMKNGIYFPNRYAQFPSGGATLATEFTSQTGLFYDGRKYNIYKNDFTNSIPNMFEKYGYTTTFIHENVSTYYNRSEIIKAVGFDNYLYVYEEIENHKNSDDTQLVTNDEIYNKIVNNKQGKFMTLITTMAAHGPYVNNGICNGDKELKDNEKACFKYLSRNTDDFIRLLMERLKEDKLLDDTVLVLFSDHYAYPYHFTETELKDTYKKIDDNYNIKNLPFVIYNSKIKPATIKNTLVNDIDYAPTLFNMFGIDYNPNIYVGVDLFSKYHNNIVMFTNRSWYDGNIYSLNLDVDPTTEEFKNNTKYTNDIYTLNNLIINNNYYSIKDN